MSTEKLAPDENWDRFVALIDHLERRRSDNNQAMWVAPVLVIAGQAFLLQVLSADDLHWARGVVLLAGIAASWAGVVTLLRGRAREIEYAEAINCASEPRGFADVRAGRLPPQLKRTEAQ